MIRRIAPVLILSLVLAVSRPAAASEKRLTIEVGSEATLPSGFSLQLVSTNHSAPTSSADGNFDGRFSFRSVSPGDYLARIVDAAGRVVYEQRIWVDEASPVVRLDYYGRPGRSSPAGETISVRQLQHPPSKSAVKNFLAAQKYSQAGQYEKAATVLEAAVRDSPNFAEAHTNLGAQYLHLGQYERTLEEAKLSMEIAAPNSHDLINSAIAAWALGRYAESMHFGQEALRLDRNSISAHYIIGSLQIMSPETLNEGIHHLEIAAPKVPAASRNLETARQLLAAR